MKKLLIIAIALLILPGLAFAVSKLNTDTGYLGNDQWKVDVGGDVVPMTDSSYDIGESGSEVDNIYTDGLILGGVEKNSWGSVVSPMTDASGYVYPTDSGGVYRMYDTGYLSLGAGTAVDTYILFDTDDDDFYFGRDDTDNDCAWGVGSALGTDERIAVVDSAVLTHIVIGDNVDAEDKYLIFDGNATDQYLGYLDTYDMLIAGDGSTMDADMCWGIENASTPKLVLWNGIDGQGAIDIDYGSADITDHTFVSDGGTLILDGTITLTNSEVISNATDDTIRVASNDVDTILEVYTPYDTTGDATLKLTADLGDAVKEQWTMTNNGDGNDLTFGCDTGSSGTPVTKLTLDEDGVITTIAAINAEIDNSANTTITDVVNVQHFTSGTAAAGIGVGLTFDIENATGTEEEHASIDVVSTTATNGAEDTDVLVNQMSAGALAETLRLVAASSATVSDYLQYTANTTETNGLTNVMVLKTATGTAANNYGMSISFQPEDATGSEEKASLDIVQTTAARATNDTDWVFSSDVNGTITEMMRIDADLGLDLPASGSDIAMSNDETINNDTDDTIQVLSNDNHTTFQVLGYEAKSAILSLDADQADDNADTWTFTVADGGAMTVANEGTATVTVNEVIALGSGMTSSVVAVTDAAGYTVLAANSGKIHVIADLGQATTIDLPTEAAGLYYKFIYVGGAAEAHNHIIDTENNTNYLVGGVAFADTDAGAGADEINVGVYSDGNSNSKFTIVNMAAGTVVELYCDGTHWYITGQIFSDTIPAFADQT